MCSRSSTQNIPFAEPLGRIPNYAKFIKDLLSMKRKLEVDETMPLIAECSTIIQRKLLPKLKDWELNIPCTGDLRIDKALYDFGVSINLMHLSLMHKLGITEVKPTRVSLQLAYRSVKLPYGIIEDILVKVDRSFIPIDFFILDIEEDVNIPLILG